MDLAKIVLLPVASPGFFPGGTPRPQKGYHAPPAEGPGAKSPGRSPSFIFLKWFKVLENGSIFQKYQHFSCPKNPFFKENFEKLNIFNKNFWIFWKVILKLSIFMISYKFREISCEFYYLVEKFIIKAQK